MALTHLWFVCKNHPVVMKILCGDETVLILDCGGDYMNFCMCSPPI